VAPLVVGTLFCFLKSVILVIWDLVRIMTTSTKQTVLLPNLMRPHALHGPPYAVVGTYRVPTAVRHRTAVGTPPLAMYDNNEFWRTRTVKPQKTTLYYYCYWKMYHNIRSEKYKGNIGWEGRKRRSRGIARKGRRRRRRAGVPLTKVHLLLTQRLTRTHALK